MLIYLAYIAESRKPHSVFPPDLHTQPKAFPMSRALCLGNSPPCSLLTHGRSELSN